MPATRICKEMLHVGKLKICLNQNTKSVHLRPSANFKKNWDLHPDSYAVAQCSLSDVESEDKTLGRTPPNLNMTLFEVFLNKKATQ